MKCPHCQVEINPDFKEVYLGEYESEMYYSLFCMRCQNPKCKRPILSLGKSKRVDGSTGRVILYGKGEEITYQQIFPVGSNRIPAAPEVEQIFAEDYMKLVWYFRLVRKQVQP